MLISKKSPRTSERFGSRFGSGAPGDFPLRRYLRLREDLGTGTLHAALTATLVGLILVLGRAFDGLFRTHGLGLNPWYRRGMWVLVAVFALSVLRRLCYKLLEMRQIRREMHDLRATFRQPGDDDGAPAGRDRLNR